MYHVVIDKSATYFHGTPFPTVPVGSPQNMLISRTSASTVNVHWDNVPLKELRGQLVSYEIGYESIEMKERECQVDYSHTTTMSTEQESYTMNQLDPGLQYCVRVAARTSAGVGPFSQSHISCKSHANFG